LQPPPVTCLHLEFTPVERRVVSRKAVGGWVRARICGAEQRSAVGEVRRAAADRRGGFMRCRVQRQREATAAAPRSEQRRLERDKRTVPADCSPRGRRPGLQARPCGPQGRAPQSERPGPPARSLARADLRAKATQTLAKVLNGPEGEIRESFILVIPPSGSRAPRQHANPRETAPRSGSGAPCDRCLRAGTRS
jgi:hypothetical protein